MRELHKEKTITRKSVFKLALSVLLVGVLMVSLTACFRNNRGGLTNEQIEQALKDNDRPYQNINKGNVGNTLSNVFFDWTVKSVTTTDSLTDLAGDKRTPVVSNSRFVVVDTTVKNTTGSTIPVGDYDFFIMYEHNGKYVEDVAYNNFKTDMYPSNTQLVAGATASGLVVFDAPVDVTFVLICYYEIYDSGAVGDPYLFTVTLN